MNQKTSKNAPKNLPKSTPKLPKIGPKTDPKTGPRAIKNVIFNEKANDPKLAPTWLPKCSQVGVQNPPKILPKTTPKRARILNTVWYRKTSIFGSPNLQFWTHFGTKRVSQHQLTNLPKICTTPKRKPHSGGAGPLRNPYKIVKNRVRKGLPKMIPKNEGFCPHFGFILAPKTFPERKPSPPKNPTKKRHKKDTQKTSKIKPV